MVGEGLKGRGRVEERNYRGKGKAANDRPSKLGEHKWD